MKHVILVAIIGTIGLAPYHFDGLVQGHGNSSVLSLELTESFINPSNLCSSYCNSFEALTPEDFI